MFSSRLDAAVRRKETSRAGKAITPAGQQGGKVLHAAGGSLFAGHHQDEGPARIPAQSGQQVQPLAVIQAEYPLSAGLLQGLAQLTVGLQPLQGPQQ